jgi:hypothetical protein
MPCGPGESYGDVILRLALESHRAITFASKASTLASKIDIQLRS